MYLRKVFLILIIININWYSSFSQINKDSTFDYLIHYNDSDENKMSQHLQLWGIKFKETEAVPFEHIALVSSEDLYHNRVEVSVSKYAIVVAGYDIKNTYLEAPYDKVDKGKLSKNFFPPYNLLYVAFKIKTDLSEEGRNYSYIGLTRVFPDLYFNNIEFKTIDVVGDSIKRIELNHCSGKFVSLISLHKDCSVNLSHTHVDTLQFANLENIPDINFDTATSTVLILSDIKFDRNINFYGMQLPKYLQLYNLTVINQSSKIDLTSFQFSDSSNCQLTLGDFDYTKIKLNYQYFKLRFPTDSLGKELVGNDIKENIYTYLLDEQKRDGFSIGQEKLDKEFKIFKYNRDNSLLGKFSNLLDKWWWDYGYNKKLIVLRSIELMLFFFIINLFLFRKLIYSGYTINQFIFADQMLTDKYGRQWKRIPFKAFYCLLYTGYIFWALKIDIEKIKLENILLAIWIIFQYLTGIVCLAWIAYYIVSR